MELLAISIAALGTLFLLALGAVTIFFGITADAAEDFPFKRIAWLRPATAVSLVAVGQSFFLLLAEPLHAAAAFMVFAAAAVYITFVWLRERARAS